ncbi:hypothetical protein [Streptomyces sp. Je 1-369]|uniref:hypothetical protein n=1 Tax=Streptomyces sp. Je 1-369 TaxID=2966192 RepID=UPI0022867E4B|nr:hypothetical protein [Streptomyces sp. Je 1-369]WAL95810.1 hypothetical protein NOO62_15700 [Streptomyces sp. Je 1-369]
MLYRKTALRIAAPVAVLALALTACGGGDDKKSDDKKADAPKSQNKPAEPTALKAGETTTGQVKEDKATVTYDVAAQKIDVGTAAETKKLVSDPKQAKGLVVATAHMKITHKAGAPLTDTPDVAETTEIYADGTRGGLLIGAAEDAPGCEDELDLEGWKKGETHELCETYLIPEGSKNLEVRWSAKEDGKQVTWKVAGK